VKSGPRGSWQASFELRIVRTWSTWPYLRVHCTWMKYARLLDLKTNFFYHAMYWKFWNDAGSQWSAEFKIHGFFTFSMKISIDCTNALNLSFPWEIFKFWILMDYGVLFHTSNYLLNKNAHIASPNRKIYAIAFWVKSGFLTHKTQKGTLINIFTTTTLSEILRTYFCSLNPNWWKMSHQICCMIILNVQKQNYNFSILGRNLWPKWFGDKHSRLLPQSTSNFRNFKILERSFEIFKAKASLAYLDTFLTFFQENFKKFRKNSLDNFRNCQNQVCRFFMV
jgi:hypothetical protein